MRDFEHRITRRPRGDYDEHTPDALASGLRQLIKAVQP